jgi:hypothetical protein
VGVGPETSRVSDLDASIDCVPTHGLTGDGDAKRAEIFVTTIGRHLMTPLRARLPFVAALSCVLCLAACGSSSSSASKTAGESPAAESISIPVCYDAAKAAMAGFLGVQAQQITTGEKTGTTGDPQ